MKKTIYIIIFVIGAGIFSCTPDKYEVFDFESNPSQVDSVELVPNSHILYADGVSELNVQIRAYDINKVWRKAKVTLGDGSVTSRDTLHTDVYEVTNSRMQEAIKFFKEDGTPLPENARISTTTVEDFKIYAQVGDIQSDMLEIDVREPFPAKTKKVIPVIFHVLESDGIGASMPRIDTRYVQVKMSTLNAVFSQRALNASNGANANIEFKLALYAPDGSKLEEEGINRQSTPLEGAAMQPFLVSNTWDPKKYMNVYICSYPPSNTLPHTILEGVDPIQGLVSSSKIVRVGEDEPLDLSVPEKSGIIIGAYDWGTRYFWTVEFWFNWEIEFCKYLGLHRAYLSDFCSDTYLYGERAFYPTNVLGNGGQRSVFSGEQVERLHWVLENCPTHWAWKSDFAFTGVE